jgi:glycosyltransferase involved in cell wall biosynthesis
MTRHAPGMRILLVTDTVGGVWAYSLELAHALKPLAFEAVLAVTGPSPSVEQRAAAAGIRLIDMGLPLEWLDTNAREMMRAGEELARVASREAVDVVQTSSAALLAGAGLDCPSVAVQHSCVATWWDAVKGTPLPREFQWRRELVAQGLARADAVVAPTSAFAAATERVYALDSSVVTVHNGRSALGSRALPQGDFVFTAGRLWDEGKNVQTLDRAAARIEAPFHAAGPLNGPNGAAIAPRQMSAVGELSETILGGLLAARPVFASAALYEPFGLSVLEAAQAGCGLVLSDIPTHRELWDGVAIFADPRDDRGFASAINQLLEDRPKRLQLGDRAQTHARRYTPERMAHAMADIYARVLQPHQLIAGAA